MGQEKQNQEVEKGALRQLREARKGSIAGATTRMKEQKRIIQAIKGELAQGGKTVPEIAAATGISPDSVMWYVATMKKYAQVTEGAKDGSYFRYHLAESDAAED